MSTSSSPSPSTSPSPRGLRILCIAVTLLCLATSALIAGLCYFSFQMKEDIEEIKSLIRQTNKVSSDHNSQNNVVHEIRMEHASFVKQLDAELKDTRGLKRDETIEELKEIKESISRTKSCSKNSATSEDISNIVEEFRKERAAFMKSITSELQSIKRAIAEKERHYSPDTKSQDPKKEEWAQSCQANDTMMNRGTDDTTKNSIAEDDDPHYQFEPGDNIEIITYLGKGKSALFPGVVSEVKPNDLYDLVRFDKSTIMRDVKREHFRKYQVYPKGTQAYLSKLRQNERRQSYVDNHIPVTIVDHYPTEKPAEKRSDLHGKYSHTLNNDPSGVIHVVQALRVHRVIEE